MRPISPALMQRAIDSASTIRVMVDGRNESVADIRQRADQWTASDGWNPAGNLEVLADGGVRLKATAGAAVGPTTQNASYRDKESGYTSGNYIDPIHGIPAPATFVGVLGSWSGTQAAVAYGSIQAWLNPRFDATKPKFVATWELVLYQLDFAKNPDGSRVVDRNNNNALVITLTPVAQVQVPATGEAAGFVVFPFQDATGKSTPWHPDAAGATGASTTPTGSFFLVVCHGYDAKGLPAQNIAWGYDNAHTNFTSGSGNNVIKLSGEAIIWVDALIPKLELGQSAQIGIPALQFVPVSFAATATLTFKTGSPIDLGAAPSAASLIEFAVRPETPPGTTVLAEVAQDPAGGFITFTDGQTAAALSLAAQRKYDMRVTLTASAGADRTPIVRLLGARVVATQDFSDLVDVVQYTEQTDPITHKSETEEAVIRILHDGERDYRDAVSLLLSQNPPGQFYFRIYVGDRALNRSEEHTS